MLHIPFRVPDSPPCVLPKSYRGGHPSQSHSDGALLDLAIAAQSNDRDEWLSKIIAADRTSSLSWRRKRSWVLEGFNANNALPIPDAWPEGEVKTGHEGLRQWSARSRFREACARHWWRSYWLLRPHRKRMQRGSCFCTQPIEGRGSGWTVMHERPMMAHRFIGSRLVKPA